MIFDALFILEGGYMINELEAMSEWVQRMGWRAVVAGLHAAPPPPSPGPKKKAATTRVRRLYEREGAGKTKRQQ